MIISGTIQLAKYYQYKSIEAKFKQKWAATKGDVGEVKAVYVIENQALKMNWILYRQSLPPEYQQVEEHYHGTRLMCDITNMNDLCCARECNVCRIAESGFDEQKIRTNITKFQRFGRGFYLAPNSSKCHEYTQGAFNYRALLLCDVCPGNKYKLQKTDQSLSGPPSARYHSVYGQPGQSLNFEEIVLPRADAILPRFIIVYKKNGTDKLIN